jgi:hypothetical protein
VSWTSLSAKPESRGGNPVATALSVRLMFAATAC